MIEYYIEENGTVKEIGECIPHCWINIQPPYENEKIEDLAEFLSIPIDFIMDSLDLNERSRYEVEDNGRLIIINTPVVNELDQKNEAFYITVPIGIILTQDYIITVTAYESDVIKKFLTGHVKNFHPMNHSRFVLQLLEQNVLRYLEFLKKLNLKRNIVEKELYSSARNEELKQLLRIEKSLVYFVNSLNANELLKMKMKRVNFLKIEGDEQLVDLFEDIIIDNSQALEMANVYTNILSGTMETYASIVSNNFNFYINRLTIITIALAVPTLVASLFGMNVPLPFDNSVFSFYLIITISIVGSILLVLFFRRKNFF